MPGGPASRQGKAGSQRIRVEGLGFIGFLGFLGFIGFRVYRVQGLGLRV